MSENRNQSSSNSSTKRAEELLTRTGQTVGMFASLAGLRLARIGAFAREEFEDMWAEAQELRNSQGGGPSETAQTVNKVAETAADTAGTAGEAVKKDAGPKKDAGSDKKTVESTDSARRWAEKLGVDLQTVKGTGMDGTITVEDVRKKSREEDKG